MATDNRLPIIWDLVDDDAIVEGMAWARYRAITFGDGTVWDTSGYTAAMTIRNRYGGDVLLTATTDDGTLITGGTLDSQDVTIGIELPPAATGAPAMAALYEALGVYDLWLYDTGGSPTMAYTGRVGLVRRVTT